MTFFVFPPSGKAIWFAGRLCGTVRAVGTFRPGATGAVIKGI